MVDKSPLASQISAITIFASDLAKSREFYGRFLQAKPVYEDEDSTAFQAGAIIINLLRYEAVPELVEPQTFSKSGVRAVYTLMVADVDAAVAALTRSEITPINGPINRPWGVRTANFSDPDGYVWELNSDTK